MKFLASGGDKMHHETCEKDASWGNKDTSWGSINKWDKNK